MNKSIRIDLQLDTFFDEKNLKKKQKFHYRKKINEMEAEIKQKFIDIDMGCVVGRQGRLGWHLAIFISLFNQHFLIQNFLSSIYTFIACKHEPHTKYRKQQCRCSRFSCIHNFPFDSTEPNIYLNVKLRQCV